jgi:hypothetical protein
MKDPAKFCPEWYWSFRNAALVVGSVALALAILEIVRVLIFRLPARPSVCNGGYSQLAMFWPVMALILAIALYVVGRLNPVKATPEGIVAASYWGRRGLVEWREIRTVGVWTRRLAPGGRHV